MKAKGKLYIFEGVDGAGKTAISRMFLQALKEQGLRAHLFGFPGKTPNTLGNMVYNLHHTPQKYAVNSLTPSSLQAMHIAAHLDKIEQNIIPFLENGENIVLDRFWWSTWVYGLVSGVPKKLIKQLVGVERIAWNSWSPTCVFYVMRKQPSESVDTTNLKQIHAFYTKLIKSEFGKYPIKTIENNAALNVTVKRVLDCIS